MKKGFTLIELLAVIIILAIILVIAVPGISGIIESTKKVAFEDQVKLVQRAAVLKYDMNPSYDFSIVNKSNIKHELDIDVSTFDAVGIEVNNDKVTTTIIKDGITITSSNNPVINNAKVYGLSWDGNITFTRTDDATPLTTVQVGVGNEEVTNNFDTAEIYSEIVEETDEYGNQFIKIPKFYIKKTVKDNAWTWQISKNQKDADYYLPACFVDEEIGKILPYVLVGKYNASLNAGKLESKTGEVPLVSQNITTFRNYAQANGSGYQILDVHVVDILQTLFYIEFATLDSQSVMKGFTSGQFKAAHTISSINGTTLTLPTGVAANYKIGQMIDIGTSLGNRKIAKNLRIIGVSNDTITYEIVSNVSELGVDPIATTNIVYNVSYLTGTTDGVTAKSGSLISNNDGKYAMKYRGIENFYGNLWQFVDGINIKADNQAYVSRNATAYDSYTYAGDYVKVGYVNANTNGYVLTMGYDKNNPFIQLPTTVGSGQYNDYYYQASGNRIAVLGGRWDRGAIAGASSWHLYDGVADTFRIIIGSRLLKTPF